MKTFQHLLNEIKNDKDTKFIKNVLKDIQPWLNEIGGLKNLDKQIIYRGTDHPDDTIRQVRRDRKPLDTVPLIAGMVDDWFLENYAHRYRTQALFVTNDIGTANRFGEPVIILPIGKFNYVWSKKTNDLTPAIDNSVVNLDFITDGRTTNANKQSTIGRIYWKHNVRLLERLFSDAALDDWKNLTAKNQKILMAQMNARLNIEINRIMDGLKYIDTDIKGAIKKGTEIAIDVDKYYIVSSHPKNEFAKIFSKKVNGFNTDKDILTGIKNEDF